MFCICFIIIIDLIFIHFACHAFTSPSCSPREKSSLPIFCKCGEPCYK
jgi:hypothetical protein